MRRSGFFWQKLIRFEYWPFWVFYFPFLLAGLYFALRARRLLYFSAVNPDMHLGGLFHYSKGRVLFQLASKYRPRTALHEDASKPETFYVRDFEFPFIFKPDFGERGKGVALVRSLKEWRSIYKAVRSPFLIQEYIDYPLEFGVLYYKTGTESGIISIVSKGFLTITGDGETTFGQLLNANIRASGNRDHLQEKFRNRMEEVLPAGESVLLEEIGNHCRGTEFINSNNLITPELVKVFDEIAAPLSGFHYGRFDLKVPSLEDLYAGRNIKVLEVNGVNSEAAHIYDKKMRLKDAYRDVWNQQRLVYRLAKRNIAKGVQTPSLAYFIKALYAYWKA
ncbi:MAG: hypothetical protein MI784_15515 [Cytophagales bacterium]|nr:hypothetical protein [Cytophagales bacterium]